MNPDDYKDVIRAWLPDWCGHGKKPPIVFARGAFGDLFVSRNDDVGQMNVHYGRYIHELGEVDLFLEFSLDKDDVSHALDGTLARKAMKKLGPIGHDEMFTFAPALALGLSDHRPLPSPTAHAEPPALE